jgi:hypothetical protein
VIFEISASTVSVAVFSAALTAESTRSCSISTSSGSTHSGEITID